MIVNFNHVFKDLDGNVIPRPVKKKVIEGGKEVVVTINEDLTLRSISTDVLLGQQPKEEISGDEKVERYELAKVIHAGGQIDLESEQVSLLKKLISKLYVPLVVGPALKLLEGKEDE